MKLTGKWLVIGFAVISLGSIAGIIIAPIDLRVFVGVSGLFVALFLVIVESFQRVRIGKSALSGLADRLDSIESRLGSFEAALKSSRAVDAQVNADVGRGVHDLRRSVHELSGEISSFRSLVSTSSFRNSDLPPDVEQILADLLATSQDALSSIRKLEGGPRRERRVVKPHSGLLVGDDYSVEPEVVRLSQRDLHFLSVHGPREVEASLQLFRRYSPESIMPPSGDWALSPLALLEIVRLIESRQFETFVECGSGVSSLWFGLAMRKMGHGHVYALEHDPKYVEQTRHMVDLHGLTEFVSILHAPLVESSEVGVSGIWYDPRVLDGIDRSIDAVLVDGPPAASEGDRSHGLPILAPRLSEEAWVFVDDYVRVAEFRMVANWLDSFPEFKRVPSSTRQMAILHRSSSIG